MTFRLSPHILTAVLLALAIVGCKRIPSGVIPPDRMAVLLADMYQGESMIEYNGNVYFTDSAKKVVKQSIFAANGVSQADFDNSLVWYGHNISEFVKVCDDAISLLEKRIEEIPLDVIGSAIRVAGDSAQVWTLPSYYRITDGIPSRYISFVLDSDDEWKKGDCYDLDLKITPGKSPIQTLLAVDYADSVTQYVSSSADAAGWLKTHLQLDSVLTPSRIYGYINFDPREVEIVYIDSVSLMRTRLNPNVYYRRSVAKTIRPHSASK